MPLVEQVDAVEEMAPIVTGPPRLGAGAELETVDEEDAEAGMGVPET